MDNRPIGIFDSGIGGLTCEKVIADVLPGENIIYFGDTLRAPYGTRSKEQVIEFTLQISDFLMGKGVKALVIACNTITSVAIPAIKNKYPEVPVIGVIHPACVHAARSFGKGDTVGIIATEGTIKSGVYEETIKALNPDINVLSKPTQKLVTLIEDGIRGKELDDTIRDYLDDFKCDALILGCTHFPHVAKDIERLYPGLELIDPAKYLAMEVKKVLTENNILAETNNSQNGLNSASREFYGSKITPEYIRLTDGKAREHVL